MGFVVNDDTFTLDFADGPCEGMEITCRDLSGGEMLDLQDTRSEATKELARSWLEDASAFFIKAVLSWNLEERIRTEDGESVNPVPVTVGDFWRVLSLKRIRVVIVAWLESVAGTPAPLSIPSSGGDPSPELSSMMDLSSVSQPNSDEPSTSSAS